MKLLVLDNIGSFSLVNQFKTKLNGQVYSMGNVETDEMWSIFKRVAPDVVFVDFCNENAVTLTRRLAENGLVGKIKVVIRLHGYEAQSWYMQKTNWQAVDHLVVVSPKFKEIVFSKIAGSAPISIVPNGIDLDRFKLQARQDMKKNSVAYAGYFNKKKGPTLLRTLFASFPNLEFHLAGQHQDEHVRLYMEQLAFENVRWYGWMKTEEFFKGKSFVLSTSVTESFGMSIGEGMAMGLTPLVHRWPGAEMLWPRSCLWSSFQEFRAIRQLDPAACRLWVEERYPLDRCVSSFLELFEK